MAILPARIAKAAELPAYRFPWVLEGGSVEVDGEGTCLTTRQCLLHPNRNSAMTEEMIEAGLREALGVETILWLGDGIEGDDTDGHIDDIARFVKSDVLMRLREEGKIHEFGISINSFEPDSALEVVRSGRVASVQVVHNIFEQAPEERLFPEAKKAGVAVIVRVPFDESALTGKLASESSWPASDFRSRYFAGERLARAVHRVERIRREFVPSAAASLPRLAFADRQNLFKLFD